MRQTAELENNMTSVERVVEYADLVSEPALETEDRSFRKLQWPSKGAITFKDLSMKYSEGGNYILKQLAFTVDAQEKIGIVGRTGAGKSSIIQALFRLAVN